MVNKMNGLDEEINLDNVFMPNISSIHETIAGELMGFGGLLRCSVCGEKEHFGRIATNLRSGWPKHCGFTMSWVTEKQLQEEAKLSLETIKNGK